MKIRYLTFKKLDNIQITSKLKETYFNFIHNNYIKTYLNKLIGLYTKKIYFDFLKPRYPSVPQPQDPLEASRGIVYKVKMLDSNPITCFSVSRCSAGVYGCVE